MLQAFLSWFLDWHNDALYLLVGWLTFGLCVWLGTAKSLQKYGLTPFSAMIVFLAAWWLIWLAVVITFLTQVALWVFDRDRGPIAMVRDTVKAAGRVDFPDAPHPHEQK